MTEEICNFIFKKFKKTKQKTRIILASSTHAENSSVYGKSKLKAEKLVINLNDKLEQVAAIYRFPGVFGKFCKPNYNSVVATFCYNVINDVPLTISNKKKQLELVYIDDLVEQIIHDWVR